MPATCSSCLCSVLSSTLLPVSPHLLPRGWARGGAVSRSLRPNVSAFSRASPSCAARAGGPLVEAGDLYRWLPLCKQRAQGADREGGGGAPGTPEPQAGPGPSQGHAGACPPTRALSTPGASAHPRGRGRCLPVLSPAPMPCPLLPPGLAPWGALASVWSSSGESIAAPWDSSGSLSATPAPAPALTTGR